MSRSATVNETLLPEVTLVPLTGDCVMTHAAGSVDPLTLDRSPTRRSLSSASGRRSPSTGGTVVSELVSSTETVLPGGAWPPAAGVCATTGSIAPVNRACS